MTIYWGTKTCPYIGKWFGKSKHVNVINCALDIKTQYFVTYNIFRTFEQKVYQIKSCTYSHSGLNVWFQCCNITWVSDPHPKKGSFFLFSQYLIWLTKDEIKIKGHFSRASKVINFMKRKLYLLNAIFQFKVLKMS